MGFPKFTIGFPKSSIGFPKFTIGFPKFAIGFPESTIAPQDVCEYLLDEGAKATFSYPCYGWLVGLSTYGIFHKWGFPKMDGLYQKIPFNWMVTGGSPILGNLHAVWFAEKTLGISRAMENQHQTDRQNIKLHGPSIPWLCNINRGIHKQWGRVHQLQSKVGLWLSVGHFMLGWP